MDVTILSAGVASIKWFMRQVDKTDGKRITIITARFYFDRLLRIIPIYYLCYYFYMIYTRYWVSHRFYDTRIEGLCYNNIIYNLIFVGNFINRDNGMVSLTFKIAYFSINNAIIIHCYSV